MKKQLDIILFWRRSRPLMPDNHSRRDDFIARSRKKESWVKFSQRDAVREGIFELNGKKRKQSPMDRLSLKPTREILLSPTTSSLDLNRTQGKPVTAFREVYRRKTFELISLNPFATSHNKIWLRKYKGDSGETEKILKVSRKFLTNELHSPPSF